MTLFRMSKRNRARLAWIANRMGLSMEDALACLVDAYEPWRKADDDNDVPPDAATVLLHDGDCPEPVFTGYRLDGKWVMSGCHDWPGTTHWRHLPKPPPEDE